MFINHLLNGMILQVPTHVFPNLDRVYMGHASSHPHRIFRQDGAKPGSFRVLHLLSCPPRSFRWQKMTSVSFTISGGFHSLKVSKLKIHSILGELVEYTYMIRRDII